MLATGAGPMDVDGPQPATAEQHGTLAEYVLPYEEDAEEEFVPRLLRAWMNERNAPELLPFQFQLIQDTLELMQNQTERLEAELGDGGTVEMAFVRCLYQMELERIKYILQSYFRTRINKMERHCYWLRALPIAEQIALMSRSEIEHLKRYKELLELALRESVLTGLPPQLRVLPHQQPAQDGDTCSSVVPPDTAAHVIAHFRKDVPELLIDPLTQSIEQNVQRGDLYVLQYATVKELLASGVVDLV